MIRRTSGFKPQRFELIGRIAKHGFEIVDQMRLIEVAKFKRESCTIYMSSGAQTFHRSVQAIASKKPFGVDSNVFSEQALQIPYAQAQTMSKMAHSEKIMLFGFLVTISLERLAALSGKRR